METHKIIYDYYLDNASLDHVCVLLTKKKIKIIPFYITLKSINGFYKCSDDNREEWKEFFTMMQPFFIIHGGIDYITGCDQFVPFFAYIVNCGPKNKILNIGLFSSLRYFQSGKLLTRFMGFEIETYNYLERDIYEDYIFSDDETIKKYSLICIRKYCNLYFILNFLISSNLVENMDEYYYMTKYMLLLQIIGGNFFANLFLESTITNSYTYFNNEIDIFKMTSFKYAPRMINIKTPQRFPEIFDMISPKMIEEKILKLYNL